MEGSKWRLRKTLSEWGCVCCPFAAEDFDYGQASIRIEDDLVFYELLYNDGPLNEEIHERSQLCISLFCFCTCSSICKRPPKPTEDIHGYSIRRKYITSVEYHHSLLYRKKHSGWWKTIKQTIQYSRLWCFIPMMIEEDPEEITAVVHMEKKTEAEGKEYEILFNRDNYVQHVQNIFLLDDKFLDHDE